MAVLTTPVKIGTLELKNRLVMPPMATAKGAETGEVTRPLIDYYEEKSRGGYIGLIITEHFYISQEGKANKGQISIADDSCIPGLQKLTDAIHKNGAKTFAQINHAGGRAEMKITGKSVLGVSASTVPGMIETAPAEMSLTDIQKLIADFVSAAIRAKKAGYDGVEIHSAHGYMLDQFYSPLSNKRTDAYNAQTMENRLRLHTEVIRAVREAVGQDYPIALRLGGCDYIDGGATEQDAVEAAKLLEKTGIDLLDISGGFCRYVRPGCKEQGYFSEMAKAVKAAVHIPVLVAGGVVEANFAEQLLQDKRADLIGVGHVVMKDSLWAKKAVESLQ